MRFPVVSSGANLSNFCHKIKESSSSGRWQEVLSHYRETKEAGVKLVDHTIFSHILKACLALSFGFGKSVHAALIKQGFESFTSVGNSVMDFYAKSGALDSTRDVFNCMKTKDSVSWNIILHGHLDEGDFEEGFNMFIQAREDGFEPNVSTLLLIIQAYRSLRAFNDGKIFHGYLIQSGLWSLTSVQNSLLGMYTDIRMDFAENLFDEIYEKDVISWSVMIRGYVHSDAAMCALESFKQMVSQFGVKADGQIMVSVLKGCTNMEDIRMGRSIHGFVVSRGLNYDLFIGNTLVDFYCKCGDVDSATLAFTEMPSKNIVSWNSLLSGFVHNEKHAKALTLLASMGKSGLDSDEVTLVNLLSLCKFFGDLRQCRLIHSRVMRKGFELNDSAINSLIDAYAKCNEISVSWKLFCQIKRPDIVTWSTMISGFTHCGMPDEAISLYREMRLSLENPNSITLINLLEACAVSAEVGRSKWAHAIAMRMGLSSDVAVGTAILDMYSKCGAIEASKRAFDQISTKNIITWSAIIAAYGLNGHPRAALALLSEMEVNGLKPNSVTILSVLSACCHGGLIEEGLSFFKDIAHNHQSELKLEHYSCLVDLVARAGNLNDALELIKSIPVVGMKAGPSAWGALLSACRNYEDRKFTVGALSQVLELEPLSSAGYLLASNVYAAGGSWSDASGMRCLMKERGVKVVCGYSLVRLNNKACTFTAGDKYHPLSHMFCPVIEQLHSCMTMDTGGRLPSAALIGDFNNWNPNADVMTRNEFGVWEIFLPNNADGSPAIPHGSRVKIRMDTPSGIKDSIPAWIKFSVQAPGEIPYNGIYYDPPEEERYVFKHPRPSKPKSLRIYECHVGMSSTEPVINTYANFRDEVLPRIKKLGYNAVQIMAIQEHSYYASFGYHVTNFFAPSSRFGTPDDLKSLIDKAHELGLVVLMDIVHSHSSNNTLDGLNMFDGTDSCYFHSGTRGYHWMWDSRLFNYGQWEVLRFLLSNARWWLDEYKFDGFRFDGVTSMMYTHHGLQMAFTGNYSEYFGFSTDVDAVAYLMLVNDLIHGLFPEAITIGEDVSGMPAFCIPLQDGGMGFDYRLHMAIADKWIETLKKRDENWSMGDIIHTLTNRRWREKCVCYAESHDQALVGDKTIAFWLMDKDMYDFMAVDRPSTPLIDRGIALHKMIRLITMGLGGEGYLNFMGNEFGHPEWIDFPRGDQHLPDGRVIPGNGNSYDKCRRRFDLGDAEYLRYHGLQQFDQAMQHLEENYGFMTSEHQYISRKDEGDRVIVFERGNLVFVFNFHWSNSYSDYRIGCLKPGKYKIVLDSDDKLFGGFGRISHEAEYFTSEGWQDDRPRSFFIYAPSRTAVVYALAEVESEPVDVDVSSTTILEV